MLFFFEASPTCRQQIGLKAVVIISAGGCSQRSSWKAAGEVRGSLGTFGATSTSCMGAAREAQWLRVN